MDAGSNMEGVQDDIIRMENINFSKSGQELWDNHVSFEDVGNQPLYLSYTKALGSY